MLDMIDGINKPDEDVVFGDGILTIISIVKSPFSKQDEPRTEIKYLSAPYDKPVSLRDIAETYPGVKKVLYEEALSGDIFRYGNYPKGQELWERIGTTRGYA